MRIAGIVPEFQQALQPQGQPATVSHPASKPRVTGYGVITQARPRPNTLRILFAGQTQPVASVIETLPTEERQAVQAYGNAYKNFLKKAVCSSWTAKTLIEEAKKAGFKPFPEDGRPVKPGEKYYINNKYESVALVLIGAKDPQKSGFNIVGAHLDSPQLELKPNTAVEKDGTLQLKTKFRGGGTWLTWFNIPLGIAGRVFEPVLDKDGKPRLDPQTQLPKQRVRFVRVDSPAIAIPIEAIHVNRKLNEGRDINKETDLNPLAGISRASEDMLYKTILENVQASLKANCIDLSRASRAELFLFPLIPPTDAGYDKSMILAQGHDDRSMCFAALKGIIEAASAPGVPQKTSIAYFFDNEETGSMDRGGATSRWTESVAGNIIQAQSQAPIHNLVAARENALSKSLILSADVAHASIPPHAKYFDQHNAARLGRGPVIKADSSGHYATTAEGSAIIQDLCKLADIPYQVMSTHQNVSCGTTIGPMIAANTNALTVDLGAPIVSMHSAAELGATVDFYLSKKLFQNFFRSELAGKK